LAAPAATTAAVVDERYAKYDKMRKMLPEGAVRPKMTTDGFTPAEIDAFFSGTPLAAPAATTAAVVDERYAKYDKMRKMLPEGAVRQKMTTDGFTPAEIDAFFGGAGGSAAIATKVAVPVAPPPAPVVEAPPEGMQMKPKVKPDVKMKGLFWTKIKNESIKGTVWHRLEDFKLQGNMEKELIAWFASKGNDTAVGGGGSTAASSSKQSNAMKLVSVLDSKRSQNVMIILGKLRKSPEDIIKLVIDLDPTTLNHELTTTLIDILPTPEGNK
jgi:hypothetical protein